MGSSPVVYAAPNHGYTSHPITYAAPMPMYSAAVPMTYHSAVPVHTMTYTHGPSTGVLQSVPSMVAHPDLQVYNSAEEARAAALAAAARRVQVPAEVAAEETQVEAADPTGSETAKEELPKNKKGSDKKKGCC